MPNDFRGNAAAAYLEAVHHALSAAKAAHGRNSYRTGSVIHEADVDPPYPPETAHHGEYAARGYGNIVVNEGTYDTAMKEITDADDLMEQRLRKTATEIEDLCRTSFIVPATVPECMFITAGVVSSLAEYRSLTSDVWEAVRKYTNAILEIGR